MLDRINIKCVNEPLQSSLAAMSSGDDSSSDNDLSNGVIVLITISSCVVLFTLICHFLSVFGCVKFNYQKSKKENVDVSTRLISWEDCTSAKIL